MAKLAGGLCQEPALLMLMMRAGWRPLPRASPADAHDARWLVAYAPRANPADAHDARWLAAFAKSPPR